MNKQNITAILLLSCPDKKGIVYEISNFIFQNDGNIIHSDQHTDYETNTYFMRIEWELKDFKIERDKIGTSFEPIAKKFNMDWKLFFSDEIKNVAIMVSKYDHCLYDILLKNKSGELKANISLIISNHNDLKYVADYFNIPFYYTPINNDKESVEKTQLEILKNNNIDLIILARYMQILSNNFVSNYKNKIINIHHSFLPAFVGAKPYHQAYSRGVKIIGATSHYVTEVLDDGPIIAQDVITVSHRDSLEDMILKGKEVEKRVLSKAVKYHLENKILVFRNKTVVFD